MKYGKLTIKSLYVHGEEQELSLISEALFITPFLKSDPPYTECSSAPR